MNENTSRNELNTGILSRMALLGVASLCLGIASCGGVPDEDAGQLATSSSELGLRWVGTWSSSSLPADAVFFEPSTSFSNQTLRQIAHVSIGGPRVRVRLSNEYGDSDLRVGAAHIARQRDGASIYPWTDRELTFDGQSEITIPIGGATVSDPVWLFVPAESDLAVSLYLPDTTGAATWHEVGKQTAYISADGDFTGATDLPTAETTEARYWLSGVDVIAPSSGFSVVAFGDSIADGWGSTPDTNSRWPDLLSERLNGSSIWPFGKVGVLNQGVSGNRLLNDFMGPRGLDRFDRDVLAQPGVEYVVIMMGINDIGFPGAFGIPQEVEAEDIIAGLSELVDHAHADGLTVYGGTLTPFEGTTLPGYYTPEGEEKRQAVNEWIRTDGTFDAVLDFDAALRDPANPTQLLPEYDSGDHLHPSDAGYQAMADAIDLNLF